MNKNIKRIIALALIIGGVSAVCPTNYSIFTTAAKASIADGYKLTDLKLITSSGINLDLYKDSDFNDKLSGALEVDKTYYTTTSASSVVINSIAGADKDNVRIFKESSDAAYKIGDDISISAEITTILKLRVYKNVYDENVNYSSSDYDQYTIEVKNIKAEDNNIYLSNLTLSNGNIEFNKADTSYKFNVPLDVDSIIVQAIPENDAYTVKIDGTTINKDDDYKKTVSLSTDNTTIQVIVSDVNGNTKTYTLKVVRTDETKEKKKGNNGLHNGWRDKNVAGNNGLHKGWTKENGAWRYLDSDGKMKKGWFKDTDESWYYLGNDGNMKTSWFKDEDGSWYYLNGNGKMITSWFKDADGNWYYFHSSGKMAKNTTINGYYVNASGAWVK